MDKPFHIYSAPLPGGGIRLHAETAVSKQDLYSRLPFSGAEMDKLAKSDVAIFGLGAGGVLLALRFAQAGVGRLRLIDPSTLQVHNLIRHMGVVEDVGRPKALIAGEFALRHNPTLEVDVYPFDPFAPEAESEIGLIVAGADLIVAATDKVGVQLSINAAAWEMGIPAVFGGCYESAKGGEVLFTLPGEGTPCLACLRSGLAAPEQPGVFDYSTARNAEDFQGEPGFAAAVDLVTNVEAQIALGVLLRGTGSQLASFIDPHMNFLLIGGLLGAGFYRFKRPFHIFWQPLAGPRPGCPVCQTPDSQIEVTEDTDEIQIINTIEGLLGSYTDLKPD